MNGRSRRPHTNGKYDKVDAASDFRGFFPSASDITGVQSVSFDQDGLPRVEIRFYVGVIIKHAGVPEKEDDGSAVTWISGKLHYPHRKEKLGGPTEQPDRGEVSDVPRTTENENSRVVERHCVRSVECEWGVSLQSPSCLTYIPFLIGAKRGCARGFACIFRAHPRKGIW